MPSPVVDLNRAVAHSMAFGPEAGLNARRRDRAGRGLAQLRSPAGGQGGFPVPGGPAGRSQGPVRARGRAHPQRAREGLPSRAGGGLRRLTSVWRPPGECAQLDRQGPTDFPSRPATPRKRMASRHRRRLDDPHRSDRRRRAPACMTWCSRPLPADPNIPEPRSGAEVERRGMHFRMAGGRDAAEPIRSEVWLPTASMFASRF